MLSVNNIEVIYSSVILVLRGVSFTVEPGQVVSLLGPNGAGKSTTLKAISGLLDSELGEVSRGNITWEGERIDSLPAEHIVRRMNWRALPAQAVRRRFPFRRRYQCLAD